MINQQCKDRDLLAFIQYISEEDKDEKILQNQKVLTTPIVWNARKA